MEVSRREIMGGYKPSEVLTKERLKHISHNIRTILPIPSSDTLGDEQIKSWKSTISQVLRTSSSPTLSATHRLAAWNALCASVDRCVGSEHDGIRHLIWSDGLWFNLLQLYLDQSQYARPKSGKQLLSTLCSSWLKTDSNSKDNNHVSDAISFTGWRGNDPRTKACLHALVCFLSKDVLNLDAVLRSSLTGHLDLPGAVAKDPMFQYLYNIFQLAIDSELGSLVGQLVTVSLVNYETSKLERDHSSPAKKPSHATAPIWARPLSKVIHSNPTSIENLRLYIFPVLFKRSFNDYKAFLEAIGLEQLLGDSQAISRDSFNQDLLSAALQSGKELGLLYDTDGTQRMCTATYMVLPARRLGHLLYSHSRSTRLAGLSFLISSHSITRPCPDQSLKLIKRWLCVLMGDTDANFRGEIFSHLQKLMDRLRAITHTASRRAGSDQQAVEVLKSSKNFLAWLLHFLCSELRPTASYQHHISALRSLSIIVKSGLDGAVSTARLSKSATAGGTTRWPFSTSILTGALRRLLLDRLLDAFDDVRQQSFSILDVYAGLHSPNSHATFSEEIENTIQRAEANLLASGRADHADGVAYLYHLLYRQIMSSDCYRAIFSSTTVHLLDMLERILKLARSNLYNAIHKYPLHGVLTSLRYILSSHDYTFEAEDISHRLVVNLHEVWLSVRPVLCDDAPEGYTLDAADELVDVTTKDVLSYCWRALKESSLLMATLISRSDISNEQLLTLGQVCFMQLAELRHRGAFSTVAQTWTVCCLRCANVDHEPPDTILLRWYERVLRILSQNTIINTRRSAGIPSLICGLLIADSSDSLMTKAFDDFSTIASAPVDNESLYESSLPQVHALNCVKDILKNTRLGEQSERFITRSLKLAARSLRSKAWAVRNCGLMLFRAAIDRLLGTNDTHLEGDRSEISLIPYSRFPELLETILGLLDASSESESSGIEGVFPALHLLQGVEIPGHQQLAVEKTVFALTGSRSWHIRDKAARVYATICSPGEQTRLQDFLTTDSSSTNAKHGALLCLKYALTRNRMLSLSKSLRLKPQLRTHTTRHDLASAVAITGTLYQHSSCPVIQAACMDIMAEWTNDAKEETNFVQDSPQDADLNSHSTHRNSKVNELLISASRSESPILRHSVARALAFAACNDDDISQEVLELSKVDPNGCAEFFRAMKTSNISDQLWGTASSILASSTDVHLLCSILEFILRVSDGAKVVEVQVPAIVDAISAAPHPVAQFTAQHYADLWIQTQAIARDCRSTTIRSVDKTLVQDIENFVSLCCSAVRSEQGSLCGREATVLALSRVKLVWTCLPSIKASTFQDLCFSIYDFLNDDDEDIRSTAATVESQMDLPNPHRGTKEVLEPTVARSRLLKIAIDTWNNDASFASKAFVRAFGYCEKDIASIAVRLAQSTQTDTALFAEEKQNLYIDEAIEARVWSTVILRLQPYALTALQLRRLAQWVFQGLDELLRQAAKEPDGPLGWSTKPDVFVAGLQFVYGAQVLLHLVGAGRRLTVRPSEIRARLARLLALPNFDGLNGIWKQEIDRVLAKSIQDMLKSRARLLKDIASMVVAEGR